MFFSLIKSLSAQRDPRNDFWFTNYSYYGGPVSPETAMRIATVYACVRNIAEDIAKIPCILYRRLDRGKERAIKHGLFKLLRRNPNRFQTAFEFIEMLTGHLCMRGNAYALIITAPNGAIVELIPMHPDNVDIARKKDSSDYVYIWKQFGKDEKILLRDEVLHLRGLSSDGYKGLSPIAMHAETLSAAWDQRQYGKNFYKNNAAPPGWIEHPNKFKDEDQKEKFRESWQRMQGGENWGKTAVLEGGMKYNALPINHTDMQYIESTKMSREEIAAIWRMPQHKVGILEHATFSNIEEQNIEYVVDTLDPWFTRWESTLANMLVGDQDTYFFEFLREKLLRGNTQQRYQAYNLALTGGWKTRNEVRESENLNPLPGLDEPLQAMNMANPGGNPGNTKNARQAALLASAARHVVTKELKFLERAAHKPDFAEKAAEFFAKHAGFVSSALALDGDTSGRYAGAVQIEVTRMHDAGELPQALLTWTDRAEQLAQLRPTE